MFNSTANILSDSQYKRNRLSVINSSNNNVNGQSSKNSSIVNLVQQAISEQNLYKKNLDENLMKCKAIKTYQTAQPNHLSFDLNDSIVITNNSAKDLWVNHLISINY